MMMIEKLESCPNGCGSLEWAYDAQRCLLCGYDGLKPHDCMEATQDFRLQNDREWRDKLDWQKRRVVTLEAALKQARREYGAFGSLSGETLVQMDQAIDDYR